MTTNKLNKEVDSLKEDNKKLQEENKSLNNIISNLLQKIKTFFREILFHGNQHSKDEVESKVVDLYLDDSFNQKDVYQVSRGTEKENNLFAIADIPSYYKEFNKHKKEANKIMSKINRDMDEAAEEFYSNNEISRDDDFEL